MISHQHKCVFIHIPKNAGLSIEHVFIEQLDLTWRTRAPLLLRRNRQPELGPPRLAHLKWQDYVACGHMTHEQFDAYFKFAFVRDPWSRVVSIYRYFGFYRRGSFRDFVLRDLRGDFWHRMKWFVGPQCDFICDRDGRPVVDFLGHFETLQDDFRSVCMKLGLPDLELPHRNASRSGPAPRSSRTWLPWRNPKQPAVALPNSFKDYYDEETRDVVARIYRRDIEILGYAPPV